MYSNTHYADPDLGNIIKYWNRTKNHPGALKKKVVPLLSLPQGQPKFSSLCLEHATPPSRLVSKHPPLLSFTLFIICIFHPPQHYMVEETFCNHPSNSLMAPWTYHIIALVTIFWNCLFSHPQIRCWSISFTHAGRACPSCTHVCFTIVTASSSAY